MSQSRTGARPQSMPRTAPPSAVPARAPRAVRPSAPDYPPRHHALIPKTLRHAMTALGWWQAPTPLCPSGHLEQTLAVLFSAVGETLSGKAHVVLQQDIGR